MVLVVYVAASAQTADKLLILTAFLITNDVGGFPSALLVRIWNAPINYYLHCVCVAAWYNNKMEVCGDGARRTDIQTMRRLTGQPTGFRVMRQFCTFFYVCASLDCVRLREKKCSFYLRHQQRSLSVSDWPRQLDGNRKVLYVLSWYFGKV